VIAVLIASAGLAGGIHLLLTGAGGITAGGGVGVFVYLGS